MGRKRLTQFFPCLLPLRKKQKIFCYYMGMRLDHNRYSETRSDMMLSHPLFRASWPLYNYKTGYELAYQENKSRGDFYMKTREGQRARRIRLTTANWRQRCLID